MGKLVFEQQVALPGEKRLADAHIVMMTVRFRIIDPGKRNDVHRVAVPAQAVHEHAVVQESSGNGVNTAVNDKPDAHCLPQPRA